jgi:acyl-CoA thioesterase-1
MSEMGQKQKPTSRPLLTDMPEWTPGFERCQYQGEGANMNRSKARVFLVAFAGVVFASTGFASAQIVALGHSAARGYVTGNDMWSAVLESMLRARGSQVHVTNAGVNGETTAAELARVDSAVPAGTRIVILTINGYNDAHKLVTGSAGSAANIAAIKSKLRARGIKIIDAMGLYLSVLRQPGMALPDHRHLSIEGNKKLATMLVGLVR